MARKVVKAESLFQPSGILVFLPTHLSIHFLDSIMVLRILYTVHSGLQVCDDFRDEKHMSGSQSGFNDAFSQWA